MSFGAIAVEDGWQGSHEPHVSSGGYYLLVCCAACAATTPTTSPRVSSGVSSQGTAEGFMPDAFDGILRFLGGAGGRRGGGRLNGGCG